VLLLAFAAAFYFGVAVPARTQLAQAQQAAASARQLARKMVRRGGVGADGDESRLAAFYRSFPSVRSMPGWLEKIYRAARRHSLTLDEGKYKFSRRQGARLASYRISLPVSGSYVQIRRFIEEVLNEIPAVALQGVSFKRENIGSAAVEARIRFNLYLTER
jgi:Tfp pilus assembly protein PilO